MTAWSPSRTTARVHPEPTPGPFGWGEGRRCETARRATELVLLPNGRPGAWMMLLAGSCTLVLVHALSSG
jgi:hypothetical protein